MAIVGTIVKWIIGIIILWYIFSLIGNYGKYDGLTAEEWYNEYDAATANYDELHNCVEDNASYYSFDSYEDLQSSLDEISNCL